MAEQCSFQYGSTNIYQFIPRFFVSREKILGYQSLGLENVKQPG